MNNKAKKMVQILIDCKVTSIKKSVLCDIKCEMLGGNNLYWGFQADFFYHFLLLCESKLEKVISAPPMINAPVAMYRINIINEFLRLKKKLFSLNFHSVLNGFC